nr:hypothetical protein [Acidobacteriota bacterium]
MKLDPREIWKQAASRAASSTGNVLSGAAALAASAALWNPLPIVLWGLGSAAWVLFASTSPAYTHRILEEERQAAERRAEEEREAQKTQLAASLQQPPFSSWIRAGLLPDYLQVFAHLCDIRDHVNRLLQSKRED